VKILLSTLKASTVSKVFSKLYHCLQNHRPESTSYIRIKWEKEVNITISEEAWLETCKYQWKTTGSHQWRLFAWKNISRFFISTAQKSPSEVGSGCWRNCNSEVANHHHIFWACPVIDLFWKDVHRTVEAILRIKIPFQWYTFFLGNLDLQETDYIYLWRIFLVAAKKALTCKWLQPTSPTIEDWKAIVSEIHRMEILTFSLKLKKQQKGALLWKRWKEFVGN